jgi:hypothetical protein
MEFDYVLSDNNSFLSDDGELQRNYGAEAWTKDTKQKALVAPFLFG